MSNSERCDQPTAAAIDAMEAIFALSGAIESGLTIGELAEVVALSVADGLELLGIHVAMAGLAISHVQTARGGPK